MVTRRGRARRRVVVTVNVRLSTWVRSGGGALGGRRAPRTQAISPPIESAERLERLVVGEEQRAVADRGRVAAERDRAAVRFTALVTSPPSRRERSKMLNGYSQPMPNVIGSAMKFRKLSRMPPSARQADHPRDAHERARAMTRERTRASTTSRG